jgi:hypothetical protein
MRAFEATHKKNKHLDISHGENVSITIQRKKSSALTCKNVKKQKDV